jgi:DNA-binding transcriptional ArsR family regulator
MTDERETSTLGDYLSLGALQALTHPLRVRMFELLDEGPSTATALARQLGESTGATSYHLRILARHGFIEEVPDLGSRRERWWRRIKGRTWASAGTEESDEYQLASARLRTAVLQREARILEQFLETAQRYPPAWLEAASFLNVALEMTPSEAEEVASRVLELFRPFLRQNRMEPPEDARRVVATLRLVPSWL